MEGHPHQRRRRVPVRCHRHREYHGDGQLQDGQAAAEHLQLLPLQSGGGGLRHRPHIDASVHVVYGAGLLAPRLAHLRHLAGPRLPGQQRLGAQPPHHQLRSLLLGHEAADLQGQEDDHQGRRHDR